MENVGASLQLRVGRHGDSNLFPFLKLFSMWVTLASETEKESLSEPGCAPLNFLCETNCTKCCEVRLASHSLYLFLTNKDSIFVHSWSRKNSQKSYVLWVCLQVYFEPCVLSHFSHVWLFATSWTVAHQAPMPVGFSKQEYWSELPCPLPWDLPDPGIKPWSLASPALAGRFFTTSASWEVPFWMMCVCVSHSVMSDSLQPRGLWPTKLLCPWDFSRKKYWSGLPLPSPILNDNHFEFN